MRCAQGLPRLSSVLQGGGDAPRSRLYARRQFAPASGAAATFLKKAMGQRSCGPVRALTALDFFKLRCQLPLAAVEVGFDGSLLSFTAQATLGLLACADAGSSVQFVRIFDQDASCSIFVASG
jgi:hypothetical protein